MFRLAALSTSALALSMTAAVAATGVGLTDDRTLVMFDTETLEVTGTMEVEGVDRLLGIDMRAADNSLIGVTDDMRIVTIDTASGAATELSVMDTPLPVADQPVIVDVNPAADRLRLMTGVTNHRVNMDTGEVTADGDLNWAAEDENSEAMPMSVATGYTNSFGTPESTAMYNIDAGIGALIRQTAPNDGTLATVGMLEVAEPGAEMAFDIQGDADGNNMAWLVTGNAIYSVDLDSGMATQAGQIEGVEGQIRDLTVLPAM
ncbi:DUF4394 domain-containing protein [Paracoccus aestuarii]|uniref:DUF4394 domain-containing protein n=1 Tax=Paracoccus aestuarii TaxID=453842 RepID=A0A418ZQ39_9RHOB|nr:DUF4394 domain-containing protein [Paracoccus aestuarii]RJK97314.1 DUF4394 domain-containing protein [Paracoccus aestuarii]WCR01222.1 DUF4394 domain-containing protein [Paracoccus aestuarii]